jgi:hypothetical protein
MKIRRTPTPGEIAAHFGVTQATVWHWLKYMEQWEKCLPELKSLSSSVLESFTAHTIARGDAKSVELYMKLVHGWVDPLTIRVQIGKEGEPDAELPGAFSIRHPALVQKEKEYWQMYYELQGKAPKEVEFTDVTIQDDAIGRNEEPPDGTPLLGG